MCATPCFIHQHFPVKRESTAHSAYITVYYNISHIPQFQPHTPAICREWSACIPVTSWDLAARRCSWSMTCPLSGVSPCACATLHAERLRKRFWHAADTACIGFLCWIFPESVRNIAWTTAGSRRYSVTHSWKQEEVTFAQCLCCQHPVGWRSHRIILALQDQHRNGAPDRLLLDRRDRFHPPELTDREHGHAKVE